jgi:hypothetical protein
MFAYIYVCLCMFICLLMGYDVSEGILLELHNMKEREVGSRNFSIEVG